MLSEIQSIDDLDVENQRVFVRADLDAPTNKSGEFLSDACIAAVVPTVKKLQSLGAKVIVASRFSDQRSEAASKKTSSTSIEPAALRLAELLSTEVLLPDACVGDSVKKVLTELRSTQVCVLENLAFDSDRGAEAETFARKLKDHIDIYVADSLRALAEESASTTHLPRLSEFRAAGVSLMRELSSIARIRSGIDEPRLVIWGGNNLSSRIDVLDALATGTAKVFLVGVAGNTMLHALGNAKGRTAVEEDYLAGARSLKERLGNRLLLPRDFLVAESPRASATDERDARSLRQNDMALDLGPKTQAELSKLILESGTVIWCGTAGFHKSAAFSSGTAAICRAMAQSDAFTMVAGDDSVAAAQAVGKEYLSSIDCVSLGSTATLSLYKDNKLPGLTALRGPIHD